jgi:hypothetical protein
MMETMETLSTFKRLKAGAFRGAKFGAIAGLIIGLLIALAVPPSCCLALLLTKQSSGQAEESFLLSAAVRLRSDWSPFTARSLGQSLWL